MSVSSRLRAFGAALAISAGLLAVPTGAALAVTCAQVEVTARGENARFQWLARSKAKANWRRKVRETTGLGAAFSNWNIAMNADEECLTGPVGTICTFTGIPCKP